ncbi:hypothetical protein ACVWZA_004245 [Sphingomonas sp. UYAg733]
MTDRSILSRSVAAFAGLALVAVATPSFATSAGSPKTAPEATPEMSRADAKSDKRICIDVSATGANQITGSMLSKRQCRTAEQWAARGVKLPAR